MAEPALRDNRDILAVVSALLPRVGAVDERIEANDRFGKGLTAASSTSISCC